MMPVPQFVVFVANYFWVQLACSDTGQEKGERQKRIVAVRNKQKAQEVNVEKISQTYSE